MPRKKGENVRIFDFAVVTAWDSRLEMLAGMVEPERWTFQCVPDASPLPVLDSYVRYTFLRLHEQSKVAETETVACFNTGLLTPDQEEVFGFFSVFDHFNPNEAAGPENKKWYLKAFVRAGDRQLTYFPELPDLATYWTNPAELIFDPSLKVQLNLDHIIRDNLNRFPEEYGGRLDAHGVPLDITASPDIEDEAGESDSLCEEAPKAPNEPDVAAVGVPLALRNALEGAVKQSVRLAQRSYRIAVPQLYRGNVQLLLPLYFRNANKPDLALTLEHCGSWYRAATVLYPDWAYRHARLLSRPNSEWLGGFREGLTPS